MKEYRINEKQLEKLHMNLEELGRLHKDMGDYDICVNPLDLENAKKTQRSAFFMYGRTLDLEDAKKKLNETIRDLGFLVEDIEGQEVEDKRPVTLLEVVGASVFIREECPGWCLFGDAFRAAGYKQPDSACPRGADGNHLSCTDCWNRLAEPLEDSDHAR